MQIKEVSNLTGLPSKTIRFYEERGLFTPRAERRNGRLFRDYSQKDVEDLKRVAFLRRYQLSIEQILELQKHPERTAEIFSEYREAFLRRTEFSEDIAQRIRQIDLETLKNPQDLIEALGETESAGPDYEVFLNFGQFNMEQPEERILAVADWKKKHPERRFLIWLLPTLVLLLGLIVLTLGTACSIRKEALNTFYADAANLRRIYGGSDGINMNAAYLYQSLDRNISSEQEAFCVYQHDGDVLFEREPAVAVMYEGQWYLALPEDTVDEKTLKSFFHYYPVTAGRTSYTPVYFSGEFQGDFITLEALGYGEPEEIAWGEEILRDKTGSISIYRGVSKKLRKDMKNSDAFAEDQILPGLFRSTMRVTFSVKTQGETCRIRLYGREFPLWEAVKSLLSFYLAAFILWGFLMGLYQIRGNKYKLQIAGENYLG